MLTLPFPGAYVWWREELMDDTVLDISPEFFLVGGIAVGLTRMIHEPLCCTRGYAAVTGSLVVQLFDRLHEDASRISRL